MARGLAAHDALLPSEYAARAPAGWRFAVRLLGRPRPSTRLPPGERLAAALEAMGPSAIKLGQLLATRPDIIGADVARGLESLQDRLPPFDGSLARAIVEAELGQPMAAVFASFGPPVAAASIAQVHQAETADASSRLVAVKILRPGIEKEFAADFDAFRFAARLGEKFSSEGRRLRLVALVEMLAQSVALELDLRMEAAAASELAENTSNDRDFRVPVPDWPRTRARVFTAEWIDGIPLRDGETLAAAGHDPKRIAVSLLRNFLTQALRDGFFHADMHPGNLFIDKEGRICARSISASWGASICPPGGFWRRRSAVFLPAIMSVSRKSISISVLYRAAMTCRFSRKPCARSASRFSA